MRSVVLSFTMLAFLVSAPSFAAKRLLDRCDDHRPEALSEHDREDPWNAAELKAAADSINSRYAGTKVRVELGDLSEKYAEMYGLDLREQLQEVDAFFGALEDYVSSAGPLASPLVVKLRGTATFTKAEVKDGALVVDNQGYRVLPWSADFQDSAGGSVDGFGALGAAPIVIGALLLDVTVNNFRQLVLGKQFFVKVSCYQMAFSYEKTGLLPPLPRIPHSPN